VKTRDDDAARDWPHVGTVPAKDQRIEEDDLMDLTVWLPAMFVLGLVAMGLCYAFISACDKI
jgi:hypothetical protein